MNRLLIILFSVAALLITVEATSKVQPQRAPQPQCAASIAECPLDGCSSDNHHDPKLNRLKNVTLNNSPLTHHPATWMHTHTDQPPEPGRRSRHELTRFAKA